MKKVLGILAFIAFVATGSTAYAAEVELLSVNVYRQSYGATLTSEITAKVKVKNLAYTKKLTFHAELDNGSWADLDTVGYTVTGTYLYSIANGYEIWSLTANKSFYITPEFYKESLVVKYTVNGTNYWDNNGGKNYYTGYNGYLINESLKVLQYSANAYVNHNYTTGTDAVTFYGTVLFQKCASAGVVSIVYTTDNWATTKVLTANYYDSLKGYCTFSVDLPVTVTNIEYAISYKPSANTTYWDNNFGLNYKLKLN